MFKHRSSLLIIILFSSLNIFGQINRNLKTEINDSVDKFMDNNKVPGISLAVISDNQVLVNKAFGYKNLNNKTPAQTNTLYQLASLTKTFSGIVLAKMVENGEIDVESSITAYLDYIPKEWSEVKVKHAISHTSGLPDLLDDNGDPIGGKGVNKAWELVQKKDLKFLPGQKWEYSQMGPYVILKIIEKISNKWESLVEEIIFERAKMKNSYFINQKPVPEIQSTGYRKNDNGVIQEYVFEDGYDYYIPSTAGIFSSTDDLILYHKAIISDALISKKAKELMWSPVDFKDGPPFSYGLGWVVDEQLNHKRVWHSGGGKAIFMHFPEKKLSVIVLSNVVNTSPNSLAEGIAGLFLNKQDH
jgi:CubicO group peptidase (beta-lactamase class C family)